MGQANGRNSFFQDLTVDPFCDPELYLFDEPTEGLDSETAAKVLATLDELEARAREVERVRSRVYDGLTGITSETRENATEANREASARAREAIQVAIKLKRCFEGVLRIVRQLDKIDLSSPERDEKAALQLRKLYEGHDEARASLRAHLTDLHEARARD